ncbi:unnamed protein product, partial [Nesidiocoris tenuis]
MVLAFGISDLSDAHHKFPVQETWTTLEVLPAGTSGHNKFYPPVQTESKLGRQTALIY